MLRMGQQVIWPHFLELTEGRLQSGLIQPVLEREVMAVCPDLQGFQFDEGAQRTKQMVGLRPHRARRGASQRSILLERLVVLLHLPPSLVEASDLAAIER
jgi:hypothetical protein